MGILLVGAGVLCHSTANVPGAAADFPSFPAGIAGHFLLACQLSQRVREVTLLNE
jgi:hypothetical protein